MSDKGVLLHEATVAARVADAVLVADMVAVNELLLRERNEGVASESPLRSVNARATITSMSYDGLNVARGREGPARAAAALVLDVGDNRRVVGTPKNC